MKIEMRKTHASLKKRDNLLNVSILPNDSGICPVNPDTDKPKNSNDDNPSNVDDGSVPERLVEERSRNVNLDNSPKVLGIVPMKSFCDKLKNVRFFVSPSVAGIVPVKAFSESTK